jgi:hypothetical protein
MIGVILVMSGLGVGLYFRFRTKLDPVSPPTSVNLGNNTLYAMGEYQLIEKNLFSDDMTVNLILTQAINFDGQTNRRMLQQDFSSQPSSDYSINANLNDVGFQLAFSSSNDLRIRVDLNNLLTYLENTDPEVSRLLA